MSEPWTDGDGANNAPRATPGGGIDIARPDAGDVLVAAFSQALEETNDPAATLRLWSDRHPAFARDFTEAAAAHLGGDFDAAMETAAEEREIAFQGRETLRSRRGASNLLAERARECGFGNLDDVARAIRLPCGVLTRLQRGRIALSSLPQTLLDALSERLKWSATDILSALRAPQTTPAANSVCEAPEGYWAQETFQEALAECAEEDPEGARLWAS